MPAGAADPALRARWQRLLKVLRTHEKLVVAFSGGVDSSLLLRASQIAVGDRVVALTALTETVAQDDVRSAREVAASLGVRHREVAVKVMGLPEVACNTAERCYACKREILNALCSAAEDEGFSVVIEGSTADDDDANRPGHRAVREFGVLSPLREAGVAKADVRLLSQELGLGVWDTLVSVPSNEDSRRYADPASPARAYRCCGASHSSAWVHPGEGSLPREDRPSRA